MKNVRSPFRFYPAILFITLVFSLQAFAQTEGREQAISAGISKQTLKSSLLKRDIPYNIYLPAGYADGAKNDVRYPVIYLLHGLTGSFGDWAARTNLKQYAGDHQFIIVMPDGKNGWYTDSATVPDDKFESYIIKELIPEVDKIYRTKATRSNRAIAGLSMGGYGSLKFGLKFSDLFSLAGSFSGALGITEITDKNSIPFIATSVMSVYGDAGSETRKANDLFKLLREVNAEKAKGLPFIYVDCGTEDFLIQNNRDFISLLTEKKIPHEFRQLPGAHDWKFWDSQIQEFLRLSKRLIAN